MQINLVDGGLFSHFTIQDVLDYCWAQDVLGLDIETGRKYPRKTYNERIYQPGLDPYVSRVVMLQIGTEEVVWVIDPRRVDTTPLIPLVKDKLIVGHNLKFEVKHLSLMGFKFGRIYDTMIVEMILTNGLKLGYGLADLAGRYLGIRNTSNADLFNLSEFQDFVNGEEVDFGAWSLEQADKAIIDKSTRLGFINIGDKPYTEEQVMYGADDIWMPLAIKRMQREGARLPKEFSHLVSYWPENCIWLENETVKELAYQELDGIYVSKVKWLETYNKNKETYIQRKAKLDRYVELNFPQFCKAGDLFSGGNVCGIKWTSSKDVVDFFKFLGFCPKEWSKHTGKESYTVGAKALQKILDKGSKYALEKGHDLEITDHQSLMVSYLQFKESEQATTTFGEKWLRYVHPITDRIHCNFRQLLATGRMAAGSPNIQQIPHSDDFRSAFVAPKGVELINCDYSSQEIRILAELTKAKGLVEFFTEGNETFGDDFHSYSATRMFRIIRQDPELIVTKDSDPEARNKSKAITFKIGYGASAFTLQFDLDVDADEAQVYIDRYLDSFPGLRENFERRKEQAVMDGWFEIDSTTGRRWICEWWPEMKAIESKIRKMLPGNFDMLPNQKEIERSLGDDYFDLKRQYRKLRGRLERTALNYPIQTTAAGMTKTALLRIRRAAKTGRVVAPVHDEVIGYGDAEFAKVVAEQMVEAGKSFCKTVPMKADAKVVPFWKH